MEVSNGLKVELFASDPMITNPTNISVDALGRIWVCEAYNYDVAPAEADKKGDRIVVLEDSDQDGKADKRTIFYQGPDLFLPLGITVLGDKIYVTCSPHVFVFTDSNKDLVPEAKEILFTKMHKGEHSTHSLLPGPDGMIYFSLGNYARDIADNKGTPLVDKRDLQFCNREIPTSAEWYCAVHQMEKTWRCLVTISGITTSPALIHMAMYGNPTMMMTEMSPAGLIL